MKTLHNLAQSYCKDCNAQYQRARYLEHRVSVKKVQESRKDWINKLKTAPCTDCGASYPPYVMDFDHVHGEKLFGIGRVVGSAMRRDRAEAEIAKCELVCANCHRERTQQRRKHLTPASESGKVEEEALSQEEDIGN